MKYFPKEAYLIKLLDHLKSIDTNVYIRFFFLNVKHRNLRLFLNNINKSHDQGE